MSRHNRRRRQLRQQGLEGQAPVNGYQHPPGGASPLLPDGQAPAEPSVLLTYLGEGKFNVKSTFHRSKVPSFLADALAGMLRIEQQPKSELWTPDNGG